MNNPTMLKFWRERLFRYAPLILWTAAVLFASTGNASMSNTSRIIRPLLEFIFPLASEETLTIYHGYIRKLAHFTEYGILAFLASFAFSRSSKNLVRRNWFVCVFLFTASVAVIDEINQSFNPARTSSIYDVLLDCAGGLTLISVYFLWKKYELKNV